MSQTTTGLLTGAGMAALMQWARYSDETDRRLRTNRGDIEDLGGELRELLGHGEVIRSRLPVVQDTQVGVSMANPSSPTPATVPGGLPSSKRPELAGMAENAVTEMTWPPKPGTYTSAGSVEQVGELTVSSLASTYEEFRALQLGVVQAQTPSREHKLQIFYAFNALVAQLGQQRLTWAQFRDAWARLFGGAGAIGDPHRDPSRPPSVIVGSFGTNVAAVVPLDSAGVPNYPVKNRNTDEAMRFRIVTGGIVAAGTEIVQIRFGTEYRYRAENGALVPIQPVVIANGGAFQIFADRSTPTGFSLFNFQNIPNNATVDIFISATAGQATE